MKKTILQYMTDIYQEDIPKHILQENKIRLNSFFLEQESVQKKGTQFIFRYAFYSVEKPRKITKQHLLKEYAGVPLEKRSVQPEQIPDMKQYSDIILYGDASSPEAQQQLAEYLQQHNSLKVQLSFFDKRNDSTSKDEQAIAYAELQKALFFWLSRFLAGIIFYTREVLLTSHYEKRLFEHASQPRVACADIRLLSYLWSRTNLSRDSYQSG